MRGADANENLRDRLVSEIEKIQGSEIRLRPERLGAPIFNGEGEEIEDLKAFFDAQPKGSEFDPEQIRQTLLNAIRNSVHVVEEAKDGGSQ
jgi:nitrogen-specific signal transduction histidine kinase